MKETRFNIGMNTLKQIDGLHGEEVYNTIQEISPAIADLLVELFGDIYTRPNLDFKERELITLASLLTLGGCEAQLKVHTNAALNVGIAPEQIRRGLYPLHPLCGISTRAERTVYGESGL